VPTALLAVVLQLMPLWWVIPAAICLACLIVFDYLLIGFRM